MQIMYDLHPSIIKYEHTRDSIHACIQGSPVALLRSEHHILAVVVGGLAVCTVGCWAIESGARRR